MSYRRRFPPATALTLALSLGAALSAAPAGAARWHPATGPLQTRWAKSVSPSNVHPEYPRPQMVRRRWQHLNGLWDYAIRPKDAPPPADFDGQILVPFPVESALSGVMKRVGPANRLWYHRTFTLPKAWAGQRVLLHFGAVDWEATVWLNGRELGTHRGGYDGFSFDVTDALRPAGPQEIVVAVWDPSDAGTQPRGKQVRAPHGIWYTPTTGIWQTPWLEPVQPAHIESLKITPDFDQSAVTLEVAVVPLAGTATIKAEVLDGNRVVQSGEISVQDANGRLRPRLTLAVPDPKPWSPDSPHLYGLRFALSAEGRLTDEVSSYFGLRKISLGRDDAGRLRLCLNNQPLFQFGPLDQGFWPDGLYTAPTDAALRYDVQITRRLGFNLARKHVKIEPDRWYYWCDKLGLLVWQDMPSGDRSIGARDADITRSAESGRQFETELKALIEGRGNHPSIVMWVPFNEGWGQWDTCRIADLVKQWDPTRLVNPASGWADRGCGHVHDIHAYPGPAAPPLEASRAAVLGEFGGLGLPVRGHTWQEEKNWGYRSYNSAAELAEAYEVLIQRLRPLIGGGLAAAVYTQTSDVEIEVNGLLTYDREIIKIGARRLAAINRRVFLPPPVVRPLVPTSQGQGLAWRYTTSPPPPRWFAPDFDDSAWRTGPGGFGAAGTPGAVVRTEWRSGDIWLRRAFELEQGARTREAQLLIHHDEDAEVYLNGVLAAKLTGYTTDYVTVPIRPAARSALRAGSNLLAVHCQQTGGGQYIDVGLVTVSEVSGQ